jgi:hypothetical protein
MALDIVMLTPFAGKPSGFGPGVFCYYDYMIKGFRTDVAIVVPWRSTPEREHSFELAWRFNSVTFADFKIYFSDSVGERFNVSEARNRGCIQAIEDGFRLLIVLDADTIFERSSIVDVLKVIAEKDVISYVYTNSMEPNLVVCEWLDKGEIGLEDMGEHVSSTLGHIGSGWAMSSEMFWKMNGWDENFKGWGFEDTAFNKAYEILHGSSMLRAPGNCYRLYHLTRDIVEFSNNMRRYETYYDALEVGAEEIRSVIAENMVHRGLGL